MKSREKILSSAADLIHTRGFNHTSIQDILAASGVTKSNLYYHFESKERLGFEVLALRMRQFYAVAIEPSLVNKDLDPARRVETFLDRVLAIGVSPIGELGCPFGNLAQEISSLNEPLRASLSALFRTCTEALEECFEEGKRDGAFKPAMPSREVSEFVLAQIQGAFLLRKAHKDPQVMKSNVDMLRRFLAGWRE
jgi:TetR/AcrR family transcriptional regulator, transcriptional repressor for nem operon